MTLKLPIIAPSPIDRLDVKINERPIRAEGAMSKPKKTRKSLLLKNQGKNIVERYSAIRN
jgi:hypothetical protein